MCEDATWAIGSRQVPGAPNLHTNPSWGHAWRVHGGAARHLAIAKRLAHHPQNANDGHCLRNVPRRRSPRALSPDTGAVPETWNLDLPRHPRQGQTPCALLISKTRARAQGTPMRTDILTKPFYEPRRG